MKQALLAVAFVVAVASTTEAGGRFYSGDHPYHNGYPFMPPSSAYEAVRVRPPFFRGVPAYYFPQSYLGGSVPGYYPPASYPYNYLPAWRFGGTYMNATNVSTYPYPW